MLFPYSHAWTPLQKWLIVASGIASISLLSTLVCHFERYYGLPDDSVFVGTWRGEADYMGENRIGFRFKPDHTYEGESEPSGKWWAGGDFLYLRMRLDDASGPYDKLQIWHVDWRTQTDLRMHNDWGVHAILKRIE